MARTLRTTAYRVTVEGGVLVACDCPGGEHHSGACKHRVAIAIRTPIIEVVNTQPVRANGGAVLEEKPEPEYTTHIEPADQGGKEYVRCECCGWELLTELGGKDGLPHAADYEGAR